MVVPGSTRAFGADSWGSNAQNDGGEERQHNHETLFGKELQKPSSKEMLFSFVLAAAVQLAPSLAPGCTDTPGWSNDCVKEGCKPSQFPYGSTPGYFNLKGT